MKKSIRRLLAIVVALVVFLGMSTNVSASTADNAILIVYATGNTTQWKIVDEIAPMEHYQGISETLGTSQRVTLSLEASYDDCYYSDGLETGMAQVGMLTEYARTYNGIYYTLDSTLPSGYYRVKAVFSCKRGYWEINGTRGDINYAPTGTITFASVSPP